MRVTLGIDTALSESSVAVVVDGQVYEYRASGYAHQWLLEQLDQLLLKADIAIHQVELVGVSIGPGSFSGLRVGLALAKALSLSLGIRLVPISTLLALAYRVKEYSSDFICPLLDAKRQQIYTSIYDKNLIPLLSERIISPTFLLKFIKPSTLFTTDNPLLYRYLKDIIHIKDVPQQIKEKLSTCIFLENNNLITVATAVAHLASQNIHTSFVEPSLLSPTYLRPPPIRLT